MAMRKLRALAKDQSGKGVIKLALSACTLAAAVAMASPDFKANPLLGKTVNEVRQHLPETFDTITRALGG